MSASILDHRHRFNVRFECRHHHHRSNSRVDGGCGGKVRKDPIFERRVNDLHSASLSCSLSDIWIEDRHFFRSLQSCRGQTGSSQGSTDTLDKRVLDAFGLHGQRMTSEAPQNEHLR